MSDEDVRRYERALLREGLEPRDLAAKMLGADPARFLLLIRAPRSGSAEPPHTLSDKVRAAFTDRQCVSFRKVTGIWGHEDAPLHAPGPPVTMRLWEERWRALWAVPVVTLEECDTPIHELADHYWSATVWDTKGKRAAFWSGVEIDCDRIEEGWREVPNGPETSNRFGVYGGNVNVDSETTMDWTQWREALDRMRSGDVQILDARDELQLVAPYVIASYGDVHVTARAYTVTDSRDADARTISRTFSTEVELPPDAQASFARAVIVPGLPFRLSQDGREVFSWRVGEPAGIASIVPELLVLPSGALRWSVTVTTAPAPLEAPEGWFPPGLGHDEERQAMARFQSAAGVPILPSDGAVPFGEGDVLGDP